MKSFIRLSIIGLFLSTWTYAQNAPSTLVVAGKSKIFVIPEVAKISVSLTYENKVYSVCMDSLKSQSELLRKFLISHGVDATSIKSNRFQIGENYDYESDKRKKKDYQASQSIVVEVINDLEKVNKIAEAIGKSRTKGEMSISFELSENNREKVKAQLIENAIKDANFKADAIVKNSNITRGKLIKIRYGVVDNIRIEKEYGDCINQVMFTPPHITGDRNTNTLSISPQELELNDEIIMEWEILK
jgi:uncharacterized protein YggE